MNQDRNVSAADDLVGHAADEQARQPVPAVGTHGDQVGGLGLVEDGQGGLLFHLDAGQHPAARRTGPGQAYRERPPAAWA